MKIYPLADTPPTKERATLHHFVVTYDTELGKWYHNADLEGDVFPEGTIFNWLSGTWLNGYQGDGKFVEGEEQNCWDLNTAIFHLNKPKA